MTEKPVIGGGGLRVQGGSQTFPAAPAQTSGSGRREISEVQMSDLLPVWRQKMTACLFAAFLDSVLTRNDFRTLVIDDLPRGEKGLKGSHSSFIRAHIEPFVAC